MTKLTIAVAVLRELCHRPDIAPEPSLRLDRIPLLDSLVLVQAVAEIETRLGMAVDFERMETVETLGELAACFHA